MRSPRLRVGYHVPRCQVCLGTWQAFPGMGRRTQGIGRVGGGGRMPRGSPCGRRFSETSTGHRTPEIGMGRRAVKTVSTLLPDVWDPSRGTCHKASAAELQPCPRKEAGVGRAAHAPAFPHRGPGVFPAPGSAGAIPTAMAAQPTQSPRLRTGHGHAPGDHSRAAVSQAAETIATPTPARSCCPVVDRESE